MDRRKTVAAKIEHAREVERVLLALGWTVGVIGVLGVVAFAILWALGDLNIEQTASLILGTALATILSGAATYGAGVNVGLGAERLDLSMNGPPPSDSTDLATSAGPS